MLRPTPILARTLVLATTLGTAALSGTAQQTTSRGPSVQAYDADRDRDDDRDDGRFHDDRYHQRNRSATRSSPIAITSDDRYVWSVNPDNDSVSVFNVASDVNRR